MIRDITIVGVGLIGGSLGLVWRKRRPHAVLTGCDRPEVLDEAARAGAIHRGEPDVEAAVRGADLVVLAAPVRRIEELLERIAPHLRPGALVTDVGSVKAPIVARARAVLGARNPFIGGHPMAGSEKGGVRHADAFLFENATYVLCPPEETGLEALLSAHPDFVRLVEATGARVLALGAERHDRIAAAVSHLPQLTAVALMNTVARLNREDEAFLRLAAGGFRDMTRIASSPFDLWRDILSLNAGRVAHALDLLLETLGAARAALAAGETARLEADFAEARTVRSNIPVNMKGFLHPLADVYLYAEDRPGFLLRITQTLYEADLNIKDIELLKIREGTGGAFRLGFSTETDAELAVRALQAAGFTAHRL